jgi:Fic family protein
MVRNTGNYEQWIDFFLNAIVAASESAIENTKKILALQNRDQLLLYKEKISSPIAVMLLNHLFYTPIITIAAIEKEFDISYPTAAHLIQQFVKIGILKEVTGKKRAKKYIYTKYVNILSEGASPL